MSNGRSTTTMELQASVMEGLERRVRDLAAARSPAEIFRLVLDGSRLAVPRSAMFLLKQGQIKGWGCVGYDPETARHQRASASPVDAGWLGEVAGGEPGLQHRVASGAEPDFGQPAASEAVAIAVRVRSKVIAILLAERTGDQTPWDPSLLGVLINVAQLRLELGLVLRKLQPAGQAAPPDRPAAPEAPSAEPAAEPKELSPVPESAAAGEEADVSAVRRFARLVATDIRLYNEEAVMLGRKNGDLADRLGEQLVRGRETFMRRHGDLGRTALDLLHEAYVEVLAAGKGELLPASVLD